MTLPEFCFAAIKPTKIKEHATMDFASKHRRKQITLLTLVGATALLANMPREWAPQLGLQVEYLLGVLGLLLVLALFLFARFSYFLLTILLIVGANLPDRWSHSLAIDKTPLLAALVFMAIGSLINQFAKVLPSGLEPKAKTDSPEGIRALMAAIQRGQEHSIKVIVGMNINLNAFDESGRTPLMVAAAAGQTKIVEMLLNGGADVSLRNSAGLTAIDLAIQAGHRPTAACLQERLARTAPENAAPESAPDSMIA